MTVMADYAAAFTRAMGYPPTVEQMPNGRFRVTTRTGSHDRYTERDLRNLTRVLRLKNTQVPA